MNDSTQSGQKGEVKRRSRAVGCVVAGGILFITTIAVYAFGAVIYTNRTEKRIAELEQHIRDKGQPVTLEELSATYPSVPEDDNAALIYLEAFTIFEASDPDGAIRQNLSRQLDALPPSEPIPESVINELARYVSTNEEGYRLVDEASERAKSRYPIELEDGMAVLLPHLARLRECAHAESLRAIYRHATNHGEQFADSQRNLLHMAASLRDEPVVVSQLVRLGIHQIAVDCLARGLSIGPIGPDGLLTLQNRYSKAEDPASLRLSYVSQRCMSSQMWAQLAQNADLQEVDLISQAGKQFDPFGYWLRSRGVAIYAQVYILETYDTLIALSERSWPDRIEQWTDLKQIHVRSQNPIFGVQNLIAGAVHAIPAYARRDAALRMAQLALAIERYREDLGHLPERLSALSPQYLSNVTEDPLDGQPMRYKVVEPGYVLYSIYADLKDDGGKQAEKNDSGEWRGDWVFEVRR